MKCAYNLCNKEAGGKRYCSTPCNVKHRIQLRRKERKLEAIAMLGGSCQRCGYNKCAEALQFHHNNGNKVAAVAKLIANNRPWSEIVVELEKCILLCANCHAEVHAGEVAERLMAVPR